MERRDLLKVGLATLVDFEFSINPILKIASAHEIKIAEKPTIEELVALEHVKLQLVSKGLSEKVITAAFEDSVFGLYKDIPLRFEKSAEKKYSKKQDYKKYREGIGMEIILQRMPPFVEKYYFDLREAERRYTVDWRVITGIIGIESKYNENGNVGAYIAFNALSTIATMPDQKRSTLAINYIYHLLQFASRKRIPLFSIRSSYAGAIGCAQFMPDNLNTVFIGKSNDLLQANPFLLSDCIYAVGNFMRSSGWNPRGLIRDIQEGSPNWMSLRRYNNSDAYVRAVKEIALNASK